MITKKDLPNRIMLKLGDKDYLLLPKDKISIRYGYLTISKSDLPNINEDVCLKLRFNNHDLTVDNVLNLLKGNLIDNPASYLLPKNKQTKYQRESLLKFDINGKYPTQKRKTIGMLKIIPNK